MTVHIRYNNESFKKMKYVIGMLYRGKYLHFKFANSSRKIEISKIEHLEVYDYDEWKNL